LSLKDIDNVGGPSSYAPIEPRRTCAPVKIHYALFRSLLRCLFVLALYIALKSENPVSPLMEIHTSAL